MLCENCRQKNATSIFMPPNEKKIKYLCGVCYKKLNNDFELDNFAHSQASQITIDAICKSCGTSYENFIKTNLLGCENCYNAFNEYIVKNFLPNFKEQKYIGKKPNIYYVNQEIKNLEQLIDLCVKNGDLKKATKYGQELEKIKANNYDRL